MKYLAISLLVLAIAATLREYATASPLLLSYEEYMSLVQERRQEQQLQRAREKRASRAFCELFPFNFTVTNEEGCVGHIPLFGCAGRCSSTEIPTYYYSRQDANVQNPMISTCKCCSHTLTFPVVADITMTCPGGNSTTTAFTNTTTTWSGDWTNSTDTNSTTTEEGWAATTPTMTNSTMTTNSTNSTDPAPTQPPSTNKVVERFLLLLPIDCGCTSCA